MCMIKFGVPCPATTVASVHGHTILDMCCGSRMFWLNKKDKRAVFTDIRCEHHTLCDGRKLHIMPDVIADFRALPFADSSFAQVIFDPPHLMRVGKKSWMGKKYGALNRETWQDDIRQGFSEAFRVLRPQGTLIFKWNETTCLNAHTIKPNRRASSRGFSPYRRKNNETLARHIRTLPKTE